MKGGDEGTVPGPDAQRDKRTVFVRNLAFSIDDAKLEAIFSEVGPIRKAFTVKEKGSSQHRGFGFVQFAVADDVPRAVDLKNGSTVDGRKLKVESAVKRAPLEVRRPSLRSAAPDGAQAGKGHPEDLPGRSAPDGDAPAPERKKKRKAATEDGTGPDASTQDRAAVAAPAATSAPGGKASKKKKQEAAVEGAREKVDGGESGGVETTGKPGKGKRGNKTDAVLATPADQGAAVDVRKVKGAKEQAGHPPVPSEKQRPARTIVIGRLPSEAAVGEALALAKASAPVESVLSPLPAAELEQHALAKDGCAPLAVSVTFTSVAGARMAVQALHGHTLQGGAVAWARQLAGEGIHWKKWRVIVRNLPFTATEEDVRRIFAKAGFVWDLQLPKNPQGKSRGFAFAAYTCKADAEKAIAELNGHKDHDRPIAVDWAVSKTEFASAKQQLQQQQGSQGKDAAEPPGLSDIDDGASDSTASDDDDDDEGAVGGAGAAREDDGDEDGEGESEVEAADSDRADSDAATDSGGEEPEEEGGRAAEDLKKKKKKKKREKEEKKEKEKKKKAVPLEDDVDMLRRVMSQVVSAKESEHEGADGHTRAQAEEGGGLAAKKKEKTQHAKAQHVPEKQAGALRPGQDQPVPAAGAAAAPGKSGPNPPQPPTTFTVFVRNLPLVCTSAELKQRMAAFGIVAACRVVVNKATGQSKGNAFVEFKSQQGAEAAVEAAQSAKGMSVAGQRLTVHHAVTGDKAKEMMMASHVGGGKERDKRNLYLAKEGFIPADSPAAASMSQKDLAKRERLEAEAQTKLRSPNFFVSKTRLTVHNLPTSVTDKELKALFLQAVRDRASKEHPKIHQVKLLRNPAKAGDGEGPGPSRGAGFVEFDNPEHALVALRALNNNPEPFGKDKRPIVRFAIENAKILKKRERLLDIRKSRQKEKEKETEARQQHGEAVPAAQGKGKGEVKGKGKGEGEGGKKRAGGETPDGSGKDKQKQGGKGKGVKEGDKDGPAARVLRGAGASGGPSPGRPGKGTVGAARGVGEGAASRKRPRGDGADAGAGDNNRDDGGAGTPGGRPAKKRFGGGTPAEVLHPMGRHAVDDMGLPAGDVVRDGKAGSKKQEKQSRKQRKHGSRDTDNLDKIAANYQARLYGGATNLQRGGSSDKQGAKTGPADIMSAAALKKSISAGMQRWFDA